MSETSPVIDFSSVWNRIEPKEVVPFSADMIIPSDACEKHAGTPGRGNLVCQIQIFEPATCQVES